jgi:hypothetical protein
MENISTGNRKSGRADEQVEIRTSASGVKPAFRLSLKELFDVPITCLEQWGKFNSCVERVEKKA